MSDLLAPILYVMQNEVDAFWCFVGFMDRVSGNFDFEAGGIKHQVNQPDNNLKLIFLYFQFYEKWKCIEDDAKHRKTNSIFF